MTALAEFVVSDALTFMGLPLPLTLRLPLPMTNDQLLAFAREHRIYRMERNAAGELEIMSPVNTEGGEWEAYVIVELGIWNRTQGGHVYSSNAGFTLSDTSMRSPDASWISEAKWRSLSAEQRRGFATICPEFLVEIVSETDSRKRVEAKMQMWMENGAELAWLIDPSEGDVLVFRPGAEPERLERPNWVEADSVVTGFRLEMARIWKKS